MTSGNGLPQRYNISMSQFQRAKLLQYRIRQDAKGLGQQFVDAYREIVRRLQRDPRVFGEAIYDLPALRLEIRTAAIHPVVVDYGVREDQKIVFIQGFKILS